MFDELVTETVSRLNVPAQIASDLLRGLLSLMMNEQTGGLEGFVNLFHCAGMGDVITSWYCDGQGKAITPASLDEVLGTAEVEKLAVGSGLPHSAASAASAFLLPRLIGRLTPNGTLPSSAALSGQAIVPSGPSQRERDRRVTPDRRAVARSGRRRDERSRSDGETIASPLTEIAALREENALLRRTAIAFGALAERLNTRLRLEVFDEFTAHHQDVKKRKNHNKHEESQVADYFHER